MPTYTPAGNEFNIAGVQHQPEIQPRITHLANGGFVAVWTRDTSASGANAGDVVGELFDAQGNPVGTSFYLTIGQGPGLEFLPYVEALAHGGFVASWSGGFQIFTDAGQRVGGVHTGGGHVVANPNGGFDVSRTYDRTEGFRAQAYDDNGNAVGSAFTIPPPDPQHVPVDGAFVRLNGGGFAVAFWYDDPTNRNPEMPYTIPYLELRTYNAAGTLLTTQHWGAWTSGPDLAALPGGGFVLAWHDNGNVEAQLFDAAGNKTGPEIDVASIPGYQHRPSVTVLADGGFVITWQNDAEGGGVDIKAQAFDAAGNKTGSEFLVNGEPGFYYVSQPDVTELANGDLVFTWTRPASTADERHDVEARLFHRDGPSGNTINGTSGDDVLNGTSQGETINGLAGNDIINGHGGQDLLSGNEGNDYLASAAVGGGPATLDGGAGNDTMIVQPGDVVGEAVGGGFDNVAAAGSFVLTAGAEVEVLSTTDNEGTAAINLNGNAFGQSLIGNAGNNYLDGGGGADVLIGLGGNDTYVVDADDVVVEQAGGGYDNVAAKTSFVLSAGAEVEVLSTTDHAGTAAINLTGNAFGQSLIGNAGANYLYGRGGADTLTGLGGNDGYLVDADDRVVEQVGGGYDVVAANTSYVLNAGAEVEVLSTANDNGTAAINLNGNEFGQSLVGNAGSNYLDGGGGADFLIGAGGNDTYIVDADDRVVEQAGGGYDNVAAKVSYVLHAGDEVEVLSTANDSGTAAINLIGNELGQSLVGNAGANVLDGGLGNDVLIGLGGADTFAFTSALGAGNVDAINDFVSGTDKIALDDAVFTAIGGLGALNPNAFFTGAAAHDADDRIIYNGATGQLFYDADGNGAGAAVLFATLQNLPVLTASDITVI
jgi:Ca2+-binding RTX toxin-like protein